jgi:hypothetical protein
MGGPDQGERRIDGLSKLAPLSNLFIFENEARTT